MDQLVTSEFKLGIIAGGQLGKMLVLAASRPQWLGEPIELPVSGRDLMLAVDLSGSMEVEDFQLNGRIVNRLVATQAVASEFIDRRVGDRIGLLLFGLPEVEHVVSLRHIFTAMSQVIALALGVRPLADHDHAPRRLGSVRPVQAHGERHEAPAVAIDELLEGTRIVVVDGLKQLFVGSEGTLGFMSEIVYHTVVEHAHKASALMIFPDIDRKSVV